MNDEKNLSHKRKILTGLWSKASEDTKQPFISLFTDEHRAGEFHKIYSSETLNEVLDRFGIINSNIPERKLVYSNQYEPQCLVDDCSKILNEMGVMTPAVEVVLLDNPLIQCAK